MQWFVPARETGTAGRRAERLAASWLLALPVLVCALGPVQAKLVPVSPFQQYVTTYHYDNSRTGWNAKETALTYDSVKGASGQGFGLSHVVAVDGQVDAQPLVMPNQVISGAPDTGDHDIVFVATENNTVYAIDPVAGVVLNARNLGPPVAMPLHCTNNADTVGINSTPVIDRMTGAIFVMAYVQDPDGPAYYLHRLDILGFTDIVPPQKVAAATQLADGTPFAFNATYVRQRAALTLTNGAIFAAFGSFCDFSADKTRGWMLGWSETTLAPLPINNQPGTMVSDLTNRQPTSPNSFFLTGIWMSGFGPAVDASGNLLYVTCNSDPSGTTYGSTNLDNTLIKFSPTANRVVDLYTPWDAAAFDVNDWDFGSGGVMLLPSSIPGLPANLAVAAGKQGLLTLVNSNALGGFTPGGPDKVVAQAYIGPCWCGPSYYDDTAPKIVSSGLNGVQVWGLDPTAGLTLLASTPFVSGQESGFMTSVSSAGANQPIIWAVSRPLDSDPAIVTLYAFQAQPANGATTLPVLFSAPAGTWPSSDANANIMPVVSDGRVYVASYGQLAIFALGGAAVAAMTPHPAILHAALPARRDAPNQVSGNLVAVAGNAVLLRTRTGAQVQVDATAAFAAHARPVVMRQGRPLRAIGSRDADGFLHAVALTPAKRAKALWLPDH
jgi:hypothetical protein